MQGVGTGDLPGTCFTLRRGVLATVCVLGALILPACATTFDQDVTSSSSSPVEPDQTTSEAALFYETEVARPNPPLLKESVAASRLFGRCIASLGFPSVGGKGIGFDVVPEQRDLFGQALESCQEALDEVGYLADEVDEETWERRYNALLEAFDCLEEGGEHPHSPPSREVYLETRDWSPFEGLVMAVDAEAGVALGAVAECPSKHGPWLR